MDTIIKSLDAHRELLNIKKKDLAQAADLSGSYYTQILDGSKDGLTLKAFIKMAEKMGLELKLTLK